MDKPTDGPWHTWFDPFSHCWRIDHKIPDNSIIVAIGVGKESDARLICQAPALAAEVERLRGLLGRYMSAYPAFRMKPVGAEGSPARIEQENLMALEELAKDALARQEAP